MEDQKVEDTIEVANFVKRYIQEFTKKNSMYYFIIGFLSAKGYEYNIAEDIAFDVTEELWK